MPWAPPRAPIASVVEVCKDHADGVRRACRRQGHAMSMMSEQPLPLGDRVGPTGRSERIETLDVLRGLAILGILLVNIQIFAMPEAAYLNPTAYGDLTGANRIVWILTHVLAEQKFISLFSMLFGIGVLLMSRRRDAVGLPAAGPHYRRMGGLLAIGLVHAYAVWYGDILVTYALVGMVVFALRHLAPRWLLAIGIAAYALPGVLLLSMGLMVELGQLSEADIPGPALMAPEQEVAVYRGGWWAQMEHRAPSSFYMQTDLLLTYTGWATGGLMLVGMALFKLGVLRGTAPRATYVALIVVALVVALPVIGLGVSYRLAHPGGTLSFFLGYQFNYWAAPLVTLAWVSVAILLMRAGALRTLMRALAAVGRMALTNYLAQSVICTLIFYGHGLGMFGRLERIEQLGVVIALWVAQLVWSPLWLRWFEQGPVERLWRVLTYGRSR